MDSFRQKLKNYFKSIPISCNGIKLKSLKDSQIELFLAESLEKLESSQTHKLPYCTSEWAKLSLFLMFQKSQHDNVDLELLNLFELSRNSTNCSLNFNINRLNGSIGFLHDQFLSILWILIVTLDSKILIYKLKLEVTAFSSKLNQIHDICSKNTETLKNTMEIVNDSVKKAEWWKLRKSLDAQLTSTCADLNDVLFSNLSVYNNILID